tara:strand:- start:10178 stop:10351 length:174 start_codon:yes stop_codon:yes gene_type:complete
MKTLLHMNELTTKEWQTLLDNFLILNQVDIGLFQRCNDNQSWLLGEIRKAMARIKNK